MAMFDDPKKELKKLEEQLLKEEEWFDRELTAAKALIGEEPVKKPKKAAPKRSMEETQVYRKPASAQSQSGTGTKSRSGSTPVRNFANDYGKTTKTVVRNTEGYDLNLDDDNLGAVPKGRRGKGESVKGLVILAVLETLGIVGIVAYWLLFLL